MSLLEDIFLRDETDEAHSLERIIEGGADDYGDIDRDNSDNDSPKEDEAEEEKTRVDPTKPKRVVKNPRFTLNPARLTGPRGIQDIPEHFKGFTFKGKGHEKDDLDLVLKRLEHWAYRLYPKFGFHDCLKKIEILGKKRPVMVHLHKIRSDQLTTDEPIVQQEDNSSDNDEPPQDEFDVLLQQQIEKARDTPQVTPRHQPYATPRYNNSLTMPKAASSPSISDEQRERMINNRRLAEERRLAKLKANNDNNTTKDNSIDMDETIHKEMTTESYINKTNEIPRNVFELENESIEMNYSKENSTKNTDFPSSDEDDNNDEIIQKTNDVNNEVPTITKSIITFDDSSNDNEMYKENRRKNRKANVISSDDSEEEIDTIQQSIVVDIHTNNCMEGDANNSMEEVENNKINSVDMGKQTELISHDENNINNDEVNDIEMTEI